jgi:hypothetical protein
VDGSNVALAGSVRPIALRDAMRSDLIADVDPHVGASVYAFSLPRGAPSEWVPFGERMDARDAVVR